MDILNDTELNTLRGWTVWYVNYISIKLLEEKEEEEEEEEEMEVVVTGECAPKTMEAN